MQILKSTLPVRVELSGEEIRLLHLACHEYKEHLKMNQNIPRLRKRIDKPILGHLITYIDLLMQA